MVNREFWNAWQLRAFLIVGLAIIALDLLRGGVLDPPLPTWLRIYLFVASLYFTVNLQDRVATRRQERLVHILFPGAFVTTLLPIYTLALLLAKQGWF